MGIQGIAMALKMTNLITGTGLVVIGVFSIINVLNLITFEFFLIPCPFFVAFFGLCVIGAELKVKVILKHMPFLAGLIGRGLFNVFLSSLAFWFLQNSIVVAWIAAIALFVTGVVYIAFHFGYGKQLRKQYEQQSKKSQKGQQKDENKPIRQNLI